MLAGNESLIEHGEPRRENCERVRIYIRKFPLSYSALIETDDSV